MARVNQNAAGPGYRTVYLLSIFVCIDETGHRCDYGYLGGNGGYFLSIPRAMVDKIY